MKPAAEERPTVEVTREDQDDINAYALLVQRRSEQVEALARMKNLLELHSDAADEVSLLDDDQVVQYVVGDVFLFTPASGAASKLEDKKATLSADVNKASAALAGVEGEVARLKSKLYAKFGGSIQLEGEPE
ncbi:hypothetical protein BU14_1390s0003 [Porphyra umbilicalis]|uniref:Prefoldin subunit 4 n=1 Tax=Porphyra umbilicalis TaxID=2786 RepID=A0A1X6NM68_PORUM|nr:hypothetical protein BU14_1390s0003 [Porphyra umbilicalis]|eukprot:OSX69566.1 hypothetical protein BU14_1390s0003 [Porphyra umbilicalis]